MFCGAGGTTTGVELARTNGKKCAKVIACVNHDPNAIASHRANHPNTVHFTEDIRTMNIAILEDIVRQNKIKYPTAKLVLWASLECTNFSRAKGGLPRDADSRTLAEYLPKYIDILNPDYIEIENVEEFMSWGKLDDKGKPVSRDKGANYIRWINNIEKKYGYHYDYRIMNAADYGAHTSRRRLFGQFVKKGIKHAFPEAEYSKSPTKEKILFDTSLKKWKPVREVLDLDDSGESIFTRKKPLVEATLKRIYAGLIKFVANGEESFMIKWNSLSKQKYCAPGIETPSPTVTTQNRLGIAKCFFLSKQFTGHDKSKNIPIDLPAGSITTVDHHALITYYKSYSVKSIDEPSPTITTKDRIAKITFIENQYKNGQISDINSASPAILTTPKQRLVSCFLMNPQYNSPGSSIDNPCFTLIAKMDKRPPYLITTKQGLGIEVYETDSPMTVKIKQFMSLYNIIDIKMRMLKISELKAIMGFPKDYQLIGTISEQKKYIGNAVEVNMSRKLCEAIAYAN